MPSVNEAKLIFLESNLTPSFTYSDTVSSTDPVQPAWRVQPFLRLSLTKTMLLTSKDPQRSLAIGQRKELLWW